MSSVNDIPENRRNLNAFDARFYLALYADLQNAFGTNYSSALQHWSTNGIGEGRRASREFDVTFYLAANPDLQAAFGTNYGEALDHWINKGIAEGRRGSREFDLTFYLATYKYPIANFNGALSDWVDKGGFINGLRGSREFDVQYYLALYPDLQNAFLGATKYEAAFNHWLQFGIKEGRRGSREFDVTYYLSHNEDLRNAGMTNDQALTHWISRGFGEGRQGSADVAAIDSKKIATISPPQTGFSLGPYPSPRQVAQPITSAYTTSGNRSGATTHPGSHLSDGQYVASDNRKYFAIVEGGALRVCGGYGPSDAAKILYWQSNPGAKPGRRLTLAFSTDAKDKNTGNLILSEKGAVWATWTTNGNSAVMRDDGNFCVLDANNRVVWSLPANCSPAFSHATLPAAFLGPSQYILDGECLLSKNGQYFLALERGVVSVYLGSGLSDKKRQLYVSGNQPSAAPHCALMHPCGQLVILDMSKGNLDAIGNNASGVIWCTPNWLNQRANSFAYMQNDGNLCVYQGTDPDHQGQGNWCIQSAAAAATARSGSGGGASSDFQDWVQVVVTAVPLFLG